MADTVITDAIAYPHDEGLPNIADGNETWNSAGLVMMLAQAVDSDSYVRSDTELDFAGHDGTNDTVDVQPGVAYLSLAGETVDVQSTRGGSIPPAYDTTLPTLPAIAVIVPSAVTVAVQSGTLSQVWVAYATDGTVTGVDAGDIYVRSDDTGTATAPPHPSVELGSANPDNAGADTLGNRFADVTFRDGSIGIQETASEVTDHSNLTNVQRAQHHDYPFQTVTDETANRSLGTTYTNSSDAPIFISVTSNTDSQFGIGVASVNLSIDVAGTTVASETLRTDTPDANNRDAGPVNLTAIVPPGANYSASGSGLQSWVEIT